MKRLTWGGIKTLPVTKSAKKTKTGWRLLCFKIAFAFASKEAVFFCSDSEVHMSLRVHESLDSV